MNDTDVRAKKVIGVMKPILESIRKLSGKDIPWGRQGIAELAQVDALLALGGEDIGRQLRGYYTCLSNLRNQAASHIKWGKGDIPELEYMDSTLAGLYGFLSEYVLKFRGPENEVAE
jgi:hypothetical protein